MQKLVLKRLSASDLTLFEYHYRNTSGAKQKAINLDAAVFINLLFPLLPSKIGEHHDRVFFTLNIYGPGEAGLHSVTRKILKQQKNWRLNGELISNRPEEPTRYNPLKKDDYAILDFIGDPEPHTVRMYLVARSLEQDAALHTALDKKFGNVFSPRKGMEKIDSEDLASILDESNIKESHPVLDFIDSDVLEDAAQGGFEGQRNLNKKRKNRGVTREELERAKRTAEQIGRLGEEHLNAWLEDEKNAANILNYQWTSDINAVAPYDFEVSLQSGQNRKIDAKSTAGEFSNPIHISVSELVEMAKDDIPYDIYRLYLVKETSSRIRVASDLGNIAKEILIHFDNLPNGVTVDGVSIKPDVLNFNEEIVIDLSDDGDKNGE